MFILNYSNKKTMTQVFLRDLLYVFAFSLGLQKYVALCDITVVNKLTNAVVFQTASDFVRTGCGTFLKPAFLIPSYPLDTCSVPEKPPYPSSSLFYTNNLTLSDGARRIDFKTDDIQWVLIALESKAGECDLKTKFRNAASAGYSAIIVGTSDLHEEIIFPGLLTEDDEEFVDVHLINPSDIELLSKFAYPNPLMLTPPARFLCKEEYRNKWTRSRYISRILRTKKKIYVKVAECFYAWFRVSEEVVHWTREKYNHFYRLFRKETSLSNGLFHVLGFLIGVLLLLYVCALIVLSPIALVLKLVQLLLQFLIEKSYWTTAINGQIRITLVRVLQYIDIYTLMVLKLWKLPVFLSSNGFSDDDEPKAKPTSHHFTPPNLERVSIDPTLYHRINLGVRISEQLTKDVVNKAFREMALKFHPDKNRHLQETELQKISDEFKSKVKSKDALLAYCKY